MIKRLSCFAVLFSLALVPSARADSVTFSLADPAQAGAPGSTLTYVGTIAAPSTNTGNVYLNGDSFNVDAPLTLDDSDFFNNFPLFLTPGESVTEAVFTVSSDLSTGETMYSGTFELLGGADAGAYDDLGSVNFTAQVTPEPSSLVLLASGLLGGIATLRRRRLQAAGY